MIIDKLDQLSHTALMLHLSRKFIAVLMLLWLPIFTGSALSASVSMLLHPATCHEAAASSAMSDMDMGGHHQHHGEQHAANAEGEHSSCSTCGVCHLACTGYLAVPSVELTTAHAVAREITPYLVAFHSVTTTPLVPPPLVRV